MARSLKHTIASSAVGSDGLLIPAERRPSLSCSSTYRLMPKRVGTGWEQIASARVLPCLIVSPSKGSRLQAIQGENHHADTAFTCVEWLLAGRPIALKLPALPPEVRARTPTYVPSARLCCPKSGGRRRIVPSSRPLRSLPRGMSRASDPLGALGRPVRGERLRGCNALLAGRSGIGRGSPRQPRGLREEDPEAGRRPHRHGD
jgi:hypothetical protein